MKKQQSNSIAYVGGGVNFKMEDWNKIFIPGNKIQFEVSSNMQIKKVTYCWNDGKKIKVRAKKDRCIFKAKMPKGNNNFPTILIEVNVKLPTGKCTQYGRFFQINNVY